MDAVMQVAVLPWRHHQWPSSFPWGFALSTHHDAELASCVFGRQISHWPVNMFTVKWKLLHLGCNVYSCTCWLVTILDSSQCLDSTLISLTCMPLSTCQEYSFFLFLPSNLLLSKMVSSAQHVLGVLLITDLTTKSQNRSIFYFCVSKLILKNCSVVYS